MDGTIGRGRNKQTSEHRYLVSQFIIQSLLPWSFSMDPSISLERPFTTWNRGARRFHQRRSEREGERRREGKKEKRRKQRDRKEKRKKKKYATFVSVLGSFVVASGLGSIDETPRRSKLISFDRLPSFQQDIDFSLDSSSFDPPVPRFFALFNVLRSRPRGFVRQTSRWLLRSGLRSSWWHAISRLLWKIHYRRVSTEKRSALLARSLCPHITSMKIEPLSGYCKRGDYGRRSSLQNTGGILTKYGIDTRPDNCNVNYFSKDTISIRHL